MRMATEKKYEGATATRDDIAKRFNVSTRTVERWIEAGKIPFRRVGGIIRFNLEEVDDWAKADAESAFDPEPAS